MSRLRDDADAVAVNTVNSVQPNIAVDDVRNLDDSTRLDYANNPNAQYANACKL